MHTIQLPPSGKYNLDVSGESHHFEKIAKHIGEHHDVITGQTEVDNIYLVREPANRFDPNAIRVQIGDDLVGYLSRKDAFRLSKDWPAHVIIQANGLISGHDGIYGVKIDFNEREAARLIAEAPPPPPVKNTKLRDRLILVATALVSIALCLLMFWFDAAK